MRKHVKAPTQLKMFKCLQGRMSLTQEQKTTFDNLSKGYLGEKKFSKILDQQLTSHHIALFDLLLEVNHNLFQIDCLLIYQKSMFLIEIKNYQGEFYIENERWYVCSTGTEIKNPLGQIEQSTYLLRKFLSSNGWTHQLNSHIVFINEEFTLYNAPRNPSIILPTQINIFMKKLNQTPSIIGSQQKLTHQFLTSHLKHSPYEHLPEFDFTELNKGVFCKNCRIKMGEGQLRKMICFHCGYSESMDSALLRNVIEFNLLFPNEKITTSKIHHWSELPRTSRTIRRIMKKYLVYKQNYRHSYFTFENN